MISDESFPRALKGIDMVLYSIFNEKGIEVDVCPVLEQGGLYNTANPALGIQGKTKAPSNKYIHEGYDDQAHGARIGEDFHAYHATETAEDSGSETGADAVCSFIQSFFWMVNPSSILHK